MSLDPATTALLVIDVQNEYFDGKAPIPDGDAALEHIRAAIDAAEHAGMHVVYVQHEVLQRERGVFLRGTHGFELHPQLEPRSGDPLIVKHYPGAFAQTDLDEVVRANGITQIAISGYMTHMCCDTTAREGFQRNLKVLFLDDATATRDVEHPSLGKVGHADLHRATLLTQASMFAEVLPTGGFVRRLTAA